MGKRRRARECALQILFQLEFNVSDPENLNRHYWENQKVSPDIKDYGAWIVEGIRTHQQDVDKVIQSASENWRIPRMSVVDRNILRIAVFELLYEKTLAPAIIINEAIEIAKKYSSEEAGMFINGILDAVKEKTGDGRVSLKEGRHGQQRRKPKSGTGTNGTGD